MSSSFVLLVAMAAIGRMLLGVGEFIKIGRGNLRNYLRIASSVLHAFYLLDI